MSGIIFAWTLKKTKILLRQILLWQGRIQIWVRSKLGIGEFKSIPLINNDKNLLSGWVEYTKKGVVCQEKKTIDDYRFKSSLFR